MLKSSSNIKMIFQKKKQTAGMQCKYTIGTVISFSNYKMLIYIFKT